MIWKFSVVCVWKEVGEWVRTVRKITNVRFSGNIFLIVLHVLLRYAVTYMGSYHKSYACL